MYAPRGPHRILALVGALGALAVAPACQTRLTPEECGTRATELTHWLATVDRSPPLLPAAELATLDLATRDVPDRPTPGAPILELATHRTVFDAEAYPDLEQLRLRLERFIVAANGKRPPLGLAIDRSVPWQRIAATFELAERAGFEQVELYYVAPVTPPPPPDKPLDTEACPRVAEVLRDPKTLADNIGPALRTCTCQVDDSSVRAAVWTALANLHPIRAVRVTTDRAGTMHVHRGDARWADVAPAIEPGAGWLVAR